MSILTSRGPGPRVPSPGLIMMMDTGIQAERKFFISWAEQF